MSQKNSNTALRDIFDEIEPDIFDFIDSTKLKQYVPPPKVTLQLSDEIRQLIKTEIGTLLKQAVLDAVKGIKPNTVETKTIERVIEKSIPTPEKVIIKDKLDDAELQRSIDKKIKKAIDETNLFIPAPPIIPNWSDKPDGYVLSKNGSQLQWVEQTGTGGGSSSDAYTPSNVTTLRAFDATDTSLDELANVLGSLIASLQGAGIIQ